MSGKRRGSPVSDGEHTTDVPCAHCSSVVGGGGKRPREGSVTEPDATEEALQALSATLPSRVAGASSSSDGAKGGGGAGGGGGGASEEKKDKCTVQ